MSEKTAMYSAKHHDLGKKPLWNTPGLKLPAYIQNIAAALMRDHGMDKSRAIATAVSRVKAWASGGGNVSPEVRAAAQKALAEWEAARGKARAFGMSSESDAALELAVELAFVEADHPRAAAGSPAGGQFVASDSGGSGKQSKDSKDRKELLRSLMSKKGADYQKAKGGGSKGTGGKAPKSKAGGAEPAKPASSKGAKGAATFKAMTPGKKSGGDAFKAAKPGTGKTRNPLAPPRHAGTGQLRLAPLNDRKKQAAAVRRKLSQNRKALGQAAREEGWTKDESGWYATQVRREGVMLTVGIRQHQMGFVATRGGETKTFATIGQARAWAMR